MTVKELINILQQYDETYEVSVVDCRDEYCDLEEGDIRVGGCGVVLDISDKNM